LDKEEVLDRLEKRGISLDEAERLFRRKDYT